MRSRKRRWRPEPLWLCQAGEKSKIAEQDRLLVLGGVDLTDFAAVTQAFETVAVRFAEEEKTNGVRVKAVLPTIIDTPRNRADMPKADFSRWVKPEDIAKTILFLLSGDAKAITGAEVLIAGRT